MNDAESDFGPKDRGSEDDSDMEEMDGFTVQHRPVELSAETQRLRGS
jgi:hypothetical protein